MAKRKPPTKVQEPEKAPPEVRAATEPPAEPKPPEEAPPEVRASTESLAESQPPEERPSYSPGITPTYEQNLADLEAQQNELKSFAEAATKLANAAADFRKQQEQYESLTQVAQELKTVAASLADNIANMSKGTEEMSMLDAKDCPPCECVSRNCCCFDVKYVGARVLTAQLPIIDQADAATPVGKLEIRMFASIDGIGAVIPNLIGYITLTKNLGRPGAWIPANTVIKNICIPKGVVRPVEINLEVREVDLGAGELLAFRDETGTGSGIINLSCGCDTIGLTEIDVELQGGGAGGGAISARFKAVRTC